MSKASVDFPEPLTPVTTVRALRGICRSRFLRLFCLAPLILIQFWLMEGFLLKMKLLLQNAPKTWAVDQVKGIFFARKKLQCGLPGMTHDVLSLFESKFGLPEQCSGNIHRSAEPAEFPLFRQQRFLIYGHLAVGGSCNLLIRCSTSCANLYHLSQR